MTKAEAKLLKWGQMEDRTWYAEYIVKGKEFVDLECAFTLREIKERLSKYGITKFPKKLRVPMP